MEFVMSWFLFSALLLGFAAVHQCAPTKRNMPVIGILLQESYPQYMKHGNTYIEDNYVKWLQTGGAKVVPIRTNETVAYYTDLMSNINGVLLPGGDVDIMTSGYAKAAQIIYKLVIQFNDAGSYFPLWGTCLGFEELTYLQTGKNLMTKCDAYDLMLPLKFALNWMTTKLFIKAERNIPMDLMQANITPNYHKNCTTVETFNATPELSGFFRMVSTNQDRNGLEFVSMMEAYKYPIYGSQWHPEMNPFDMSYTEHVNHTFKSIRASQYLATFFVDEGILLQESSPADSVKHGDTYFQDNYVKYLESGGAKVVPVRVNEPESYYVDLMSKINGVLFPGGGVDILTSGYAKAAQVIYKIAKKYNDAGSYFPLWGTCLGFELLTALQSGKNLLTKCDASDYMIPLKFTSSWLSSKLFKKADSSIPRNLIQHNITANYHQWCLTPKTFNATPELSGFFRMVSTNKDRNGLEFVSMMEAFDYPFYGSQWHPEKNSYDMSYKDHIPHTFESALVAQYFANFFVDEARKSNHQFATMEKEANAVIENYQPVFLGPPTFHNYYFFNFTETAVQDQDNYLRFESFKDSNQL